MISKEIRLQLLLHKNIKVFRLIKIYFGKSLVYFHVSIGLLTKLTHASVVMHECRFYAKNIKLLSQNC